MPEDTEKAHLSEVPLEVCRTFIAELRSAGVVEDIVLRLEDLLVRQQKVAEREIRRALFQDDQDA